MAISSKMASLLGKTFKENAKMTKLSSDLKGKTIVIYGSNNTGKTKNSSKFKNPIIMPFEKGTNGISGTAVLKTTNWLDFRKNIKILSGKDWLDMLKEEGQITVICDGVEKMGLYCKSFLEEKYNVYDISEGKDGFGLWSYYEKEFWKQVDKLLGLGYTVVFIGHDKYDKKKDQNVIKGDERCVAPIRDNADVVVYLKSNGIDDSGNVIPSSAYLAESKNYFARCRFPYVETYLKEFSAEGLEKLIVDGIKEQIKIEGVEDVTFDEQQEIYKEEDISHEDLISQIKELYLKLEELDKLDLYDEIVSEYLGDDIAVSETTKKQIQPLLGIKKELEEKIDELEA